MPRNLIDAFQKGYATRYGKPADVEIAAIVVGAMATDASVLGWQSDQGISDADWLSFQALISTSIAPG